MVSGYVPDKRSVLYYCKPYVTEVFVEKDSNYLWLLKPTFLNRGRGIHVFNDLNNLEHLVNSYVFGKDPSEKPETSTI